MKDRDSKEWRDCHTIADQLTARTCFEFEPRGQPSGVGARMKGERVAFRDKVGLDFNCYVLRWVGGDAHLVMRGADSISLPVGGRGWLAHMIELVAPRIDEAARRWARAAALLLESDAAPHAHVLLGVSPFSYFRHQLPPGWTTHDLVQQPRRDDDQRLPDLTIEQAWTQHRTHTDPPGYQLERVGEDRGRALFTAIWAGRDQEGAVGHPKDRAGCRADMWCDFFENSRHVLLDQLTTRALDDEVQE